MTTWDEIRKQIEAEEGQRKPPALRPDGRLPGDIMNEWVGLLHTKYFKSLGYRKEQTNSRLIKPDGLGKIINFQRNMYNKCGLLYIYHQYRDILRGGYRAAKSEL